MGTFPPVCYYKHSSLDNDNSTNQSQVVAQCLSRDREKCSMTYPLLIDPSASLELFSKMCGDSLDWKSRLILSQCWGCLLYKYNLHSHKRIAPIDFRKDSNKLPVLCVRGKPGAWNGVRLVALALIHYEMCLCASEEVRM